MYDFINKEKIIEYMIDTDNKLVDLSISKFVDEVSMDSPAPGGGSVSAVAASMGASLISMVSNLSHDKKEFSTNKNINKIALCAQELKKDLINLVDEDTKAFNSLMDSFRMPKKTENEIKERDLRILKSTKLVTEIPLATLEKCFEGLDLVSKVLEIEIVTVFLMQLLQVKCYIAEVMELIIMLKLIY